MDITEIKKSTLSGDEKFLLPAMNKAILIAEKPSLMREIQHVYNNHKNDIGIEIDFLAQAGHLLGLMSPKELDPEKYGKWSLDSIPEVYPYEYKIIEGKRELVKKIKEAVTSDKYDYIIHAGDPDQEGELLIRLVLDYVGNKLPVKRFWTNDLTENAIVGALKSLKDDRELDTLYNAALVRQHADFQFGMNVTSAVTLKVGDLCKLGRVKAPIIAMIVEREKEIRNYQEKTVYKPKFDYMSCEFVLDEVYEEKEKAISKLPASTSAKVKSASYKDNSKKAPKLFKLSTLQVEAHKVMKIPGAETLSILQTLYEAKVVSYPRSDCEYISSSVDIGNIAKSLLRNRDVSIQINTLVREPSEVLEDDTYANDKAVSAESHTAIIPTGVALPDTMSDKQKKLYELIVRRFLAMFGDVKKTKSVSVVAIPTGDEKEYVFTESYDISAGYELILNPDYKLKQGCGIEFSDGQLLDPIKFGVKEIVSKPPARYNDGSLIKALDNPDAFESEDGKIKYSIGTQATRANIIEECKENGYFEVKKGSFYATEKAENVIDSFPEISLFDKLESGRWECLLRRIREGDIAPSQVEDQLIEAMKQNVIQIKESKVKSVFSHEKGKSERFGICPNCGADIVNGKFGAYCAGKCGMSLNRYMGKELTDTQIKQLLEGKKVLVRGLKSKAGNNYDIFIKPVSVEPYSYTKKDGSQASGFQWKFETEFPKK